MALLAICATPAWAQQSIQTAFNYNLADDTSAAPAAPAAPEKKDADSGDNKPSCGSETSSPSCGCEAPSCGCSSEPSCGCGSCGCGGCGCGDWCCCDLNNYWPFCCCCKPGDPWTLEKCLTPCCSDVTYGGYFEIGYHSQNTGLSANDGDGLDTNDYPGRVQLQQAYFEIGKKAKTDSCCCDWGYQFDAVYGTNGDTVQSFSNHNNDWDKPWDFGVYGWAIPQLYADLGWNNWEFKIGHFYTPVGYEVFPATGNFFYSHSLSWNDSEPFTHTGVLGTYTPDQCWTYYAGWTLGWDSGFEQAGIANEGGHGDNAILGFTHKISDNLTFSYLCTVGNFGPASGDEFGYEHTIIADAKLSDKWEYVIENDMVEADGPFGQATNNREDFEIANYLFYTINDCWKAGLRAEWWRSNQVTGQDNSFYELTGGVNYKYTANLIVRPEVRYDWSEGDLTNGQISYDRVEFGIDAIMTY